MTDVEDKLEELRKEKEELEEEIDEKTTCPYCGRDMTLGRIGNGKVKYGCYPEQVGDEDYDCEYYQDNNRISYTRDLSALHSQLRSLEDQIETLEAIE